MRRSRTSSSFTTTPPTLQEKANCTSSSSTGSTPCSTTLSRHQAEQRQQEVEFRCDGHPGRGQSISRGRSFQADGVAQLVGGTNLGLKWNFHKEHPDSRLIAFSATFYCELPSGGMSRQLSLGFVGHWLKGIVQKNTISPDEDHRQQQRGRVYTAGSLWFKTSLSAWARNGSSQVQFLGAEATNCRRAWPSISLYRMADAMQVLSWGHKSASPSIFPPSPVPALVPNGLRSARARRVDTLVECAPR